MSGAAQQLRAATFRRDDAGPEWVQDRGIACRRYWQITDDADPGIFVKIDIRTYNHIIQIMDLSITNMNGITKAELNIQLPPIQNSKPGGIDHKRAYTP